MGDAIMTTGLVTRRVLEGYLHCKYLSHLRLGGREGVSSDFESTVLEMRRERCLAITETLRARYAERGIAVGVSVTRAELRKGANLVLDAELQDDTFRVRFDGLKRIDGHSDLGPFHYVPMPSRKRTMFTAGIGCCSPRSVRSSVACRSAFRPAA